MRDTLPHESGKSRRQVLKIIALGGTGSLALGYGLFRRSAVSVSRSRLLMGTVVNLTIVGDDREACEAAVDATLERMARLESELSRYIPESNLSRLNATGRLDDSPDSLLELLDLAGEIHAHGEGAFDVTVQPVLDLYRDRLTAHQQLPSAGDVEQTLERVNQRSIVVDDRTVRFSTADMAITLDGIGKGYIVDHGVAVLKQRGFPNVLVEAGGDLVASGRKASHEPWRIGIRHPRAGSTRLEARLDAQDVAVATSGDYMQPFTPDFRQHHILDPRTGYSSQGLASSTVMAPTAVMADGLATLTMVLDVRRSLELLESLPDCEGYFVSKWLDVSKTSGFPVI